MKVIYNKIIPFKGYKCINLFGVLFVRKGCTMRESDYNHEALSYKTNERAFVCSVLHFVSFGMAVQAYTKR